MAVVTLRNGRTFSAEPATSILDAALAAGIVLEYSCRSGRCGVCKAPLAAGSTALLFHEEEALPASEQQAGIILTCCRAAAGDVTLDVEPLDRLAKLLIRTIPARIVAIERLAADIVSVRLRTPPASPLHYLPGQYVDVIAAGVRRSYSLACAPRLDALLDLLVRRYPTGIMSDYWFDEAKPDDLVRIEGPFGTFFLRDDPPRDIMFLATGTGIAPVRALLEEIAADPVRASRHRLSVFWGNRERDGFCWDPAALHLDIGFYRLLSGQDESWAGPRGYVQDAAIQHGVDPANTVVYACGSSEMIAGARTAMLALGLPERRFLSDAFVSSS